VTGPALLPKDFCAFPSKEGPPRFPDRATPSARRYQPTRFPRLTGLRLRADINTAQPLHLEVLCGHHQTFRGRKSDQHHESFESCAIWTRAHGGGEEPVRITPVFRPRLERLRFPTVGGEMMAVTISL